MQASTPRYRPAPWIYLILVLVWSWACYGMVIALGKPWLELPGVFLMAAGGLGPLVVAVMMIGLGHWDFAVDRNIRAFLWRTFNPRTAPTRWFAIIAAVVFGLYVVPPLLDPAIPLEKVIVKGPTVFLLVGFFFGALEEPGWRGYAQESLQRRMSVATASLIIGVFWALWHVPLFFIEGTYQNILGVNTVAFWTYMFSLVAVAPVFAWVYNGAGRSIFAAMIAHGMANVAGEVSADVSPWSALGATIVIALVITIGSWHWMGRPSIPSKRER